MLYYRYTTQRGTLGCNCPLGGRGKEMRGRSAATAIAVIAVWRQSECLPRRAGKPSLGNGGGAAESSFFRALFLRKGAFSSRKERKKEMKKLLRALPLLLLVALLLASCGAPADDGTTTAAQDTTTSEAPTLPAVWSGATYTEDTTVGEGAVTVTVKVTAEGKTISITLKTDEATLADALLAEELCEGLKKALAMTPEEAVAAVKISGLRGRGGGGFPTGTKWSFLAAKQAEEKILICNADEGDPGAFMDRSLMESVPHQVLEGMLIAAHATGATKLFVYCRAEYPMAIRHLNIAIGQIYEHGLNVIDGRELEIIIKEVVVVVGSVGK